MEEIIEIIRQECQADLAKLCQVSLLDFFQDTKTLLPKLLDLPSVKKRGAVATAGALLANL